MPGLISVVMASAICKDVTGALPAVRLPRSARRDLGAECTDECTKQTEPAR